jgi:hypothetical protein
MGLIHYQPLDNIDLSQEEHSKPAVVPLQQRAKWSAMAKCASRRVVAAASRSYEILLKMPRPKHC